jgi:hypothetical protein
MGCVEDMVENGAGFVAIKTAILSLIGAVKIGEISFSAPIVNVDPAAVVVTELFDDGISNAVFSSFAYSSVDVFEDFSGGLSFGE